MEKYKRFMCFRIVEFYPSGGISDCDASFDTLDEANEWFSKQDYDSSYIFDRIEGAIIQQ